MSLRIAIVTGAGSGIGNAVSARLAENGFAVVMASRGKDKLEAAAAEIAAAGGTVLPVTCDVGLAADIDRLFDVVKERFGRLDLLFNNAGINVPSVPLDETSEAEWESILRINVTGVFLCTQAAFRIMKAQTPRGGRIINNGSVSATTPRLHSAPYTATKHAVSGLTKATALDGRAFDIACGQIDTGNVATPRTTRMASGVLQADGHMAPEARMDVSHVADAVLYMANLPLSANVLSMTVMATQMPFVGRG